MLHRKTGFPEEHELVICSVTKIQFHSVFATINEYDLSGMIHISEIAPGRIRNIRDYVKEGKVVVCKVLRVNTEKRQVDLSLRRVTEAQRRTKINEMKHEQRAENIIEFIAKQAKVSPADIYNKIAPMIFEEYDFLFECFEDVIEKGISLEKLGIDKKLASSLEVVVRQRIKPKEVMIKGKLLLKNWDGDGVDKVTLALAEGSKTEGAKITYLGGGKYSLEVIAKDYKIAEARLKESVDAAISTMQQQGGEGGFEREGK